jgi:syndecan 4
VCIECSSGSTNEDRTKCTCELGSGNVDAVPECSECTAGKYSDSANVASCTTCTAGSYGVVVGSFRSSDCIQCEAGKASGTAGASTAATCTTCLSGTYANKNIGAASCTLCPIGTYNPAAGSVGSGVCLQCVAGKSSDAGSTSSAACKCSWSVFIDGTEKFIALNEVQAFDSSGSLIEPIGADMYSVISADWLATNCIDGDLVSGSCVSAGGGPEVYLRVDYATDITRLSSIVVTNNDAPGYTDDIVGATVHVTPGQQTSTADAISSSLWSSDFSSEQSSYTFSPSPLTCNACGPGSVDAGSGCQDCEAGKILGAVMAPGTTACSPCPAGFYASVPVGASLCTQCTAGSYNELEAMDSADGCLKCEAGKASGEFGATSDAACISCSPGTFGNVKPGSSKCSSCSPGTFSTVTMSVSVVDCQSCDAGWASTVGASECTYCAAEIDNICPVETSGVREAVDAAADGDVVLWQAGDTLAQTFTDEMGWVIKKGITLRCTDLDTKCTIDAQADSSSRRKVLMVYTGNDHAVHLIGLQITGGYVRERSERAANANKF